MVVPGAANGRLIAADQARAKTVAKLVALAEARGYHGLNVYFAWLGPKARANYTAFIAELGRENWLPAAGYWPFPSIRGKVARRRSTAISITPPWSSTPAT